MIQEFTYNSNDSSYALNIKVASDQCIIAPVVRVGD